MKIFISQAMRGRTDEAIREEREKIVAQAEARYGKKMVSVLPSYFADTPPEDEADRVRLLAKSVEMLADADLAIFAPGCLQANGCYIEYEVCRRYGIATLLL